MCASFLGFLLILMNEQVYTSAIRLVSPLNNGVGRLEVYHNGEWGTVCDDGFSDVAAKVACRQLGLYQTAFQPKAIAQFGFGIGRIWLDDVNCKETENSLLSCAHNRWGYGDCSHDEDVGVICDNRPVRVRLVGQYRSGLLQVYHNNTWGTVCKDSFGKVEATVTCRSLGYQSGEPYARNASSSSPMWLAGVHCSRNNTHITDCNHSDWGVHDCKSSLPVHVKCYSFLEDASDVRLTSFGNTSGEGRLEIKYRKKWGTVCYKGFGHPEIRVVCNMLGYNSDGTATFATWPFSKSTPVYLDDVNCLGTENSINDCLHSQWESAKCDHSGDVYITCRTAPPEIHVQAIVGILNVSVGDNVTINCVVDDANPPVTSFTWSHNGRVTSGVMFHIQSVNQSDEGRLTCTANNGVGSPGRADIYIRVLEQCQENGSRKNSRWTMIHTVAVLTGCVAVVIIIVLAVIIGHLCRKLDELSDQKEKKRVISTISDVYECEVIEEDYDNPLELDSCEKSSPDSEDAASDYYEEIQPDAKGQPNSDEELYENMSDVPRRCR